MSDQLPPVSVTPNVVVPDPEVRRIGGIVMYVLLFLAGTAGMVLSTFPELTAGTDVPVRVIALVTSLVSYAGSAFGFVVTLPNVPSRAV